MNELCPTPKWLTQMLVFQGRNTLAHRMLTWHETLYNHSIKAAAYAETIGMSLGYLNADIDILSQGAFFHDVGKITWPSTLINKQSLNNDDYKLVRAHPIAGEYYLRQYWPEAPDEVCRIVKEHHERVDGSGYPNGLKQNDISPFALIVAAVEVFTALIENRPYRNRSFTCNEALAELEKQLFPKKIIDVLMNVNNVSGAMAHGQCRYWG